MRKEEKKKENMRLNSHDMKKVSVEQKSKQNEKKNESEAKGTTQREKREMEKCHEIIRKTNSKGKGRE